MLDGWILGQGDLFIIVNDPFTITFDVCDVVATASILPNVRYPEDTNTYILTSDNESTVQRSPGKNKVHQRRPVLTWRSWNTFLLRLPMVFCFLMRFLRHSSSLPAMR